MSKQTKYSVLNQAQILNKSFNESKDALRMELVDALNTAIQLHASEDSITSVPLSLCHKSSLIAGVSGVVLGPVSIVGIAKLQMVVGGSSADAALTLQVSPSDADDVWVDVANSVGSGKPSMSIQTAVTARRARITGSSDGALDVYLNGSG